MQEPIFLLLKKRNSTNSKNIYMCYTQLTPVLLLYYPQRIFVFEDNVQREGGPNKTIRNYNNSIGIRTRLYTRLFTEQQFSQFRKIVDYDIHNIKELNVAHPIVFLKSGYGQDLPNIFKQYLNSSLNDFLQLNVYDTRTTTTTL
jgi:hypothetical protein